MVPVRPWTTAPAMNFDLIKNGAEAKKALGDIQVVELEGSAAYRLVRRRLD